jgi:DNA adenine methylase
LRPGRPIFRHHGGKWNLARHILPYLPEHKIYVEPFAGAASLLLWKKACYQEVVNDLDARIYNIFKVLRDPELAEKLKKQLELTPFSKIEYDAARVPCADMVENARRYIFRSFAGQGTAALMDESTGFRRDAKKSGSTPAKDWGRYSQWIDHFVYRLTGVVVDSEPAIACIKRHDSVRTLFFVDPPYVHDTRGKHKSKKGKGALRHRYNYEMTDDDHRELAETLHSVKGMVILCGYPSPLYRELYADWQCIHLPAYGDGAKQTIECLWLNPAASTGAQGQLMAFDIDGDGEFIGGTKFG